MKKLLSILLFNVVGLWAQTSTPTLTGSGPSYFANTGIRYSYYDKAMTETTNFGVRVKGSSSTTGTNSPNGFWSITSIDATPRSQAASAGLRESAGYFLSRNGNLTFYTHVGVGAQTLSTPTSSTLLGNMDGGGGVVWSLCKTFNPLTKVNCTATFDYSIVAVTSQSVKPFVGFYFGTSF